MKAKRLLTALVVALLVSGLFTFWLSRRVAKAARVNVPQKQLYVAAGKALEAGELLKPGSLQLVEWPASSPLTGGFTKIDDVAGRVVLYPLAKGEPILERQLAAAGAGAGLTANIPSGMRAISVRSDEVVGVAGFLLPGTHVDVLMTYHSVTVPGATNADGVAGCGGSCRGAADSSRSRWQADQRQRGDAAAEAGGRGKVVLATSLGAIHFVLRNGADEEQAAQPAGWAQSARRRSCFSPRHGAAAPTTNYRTQAQAIRGGNHSGR